MYSINFKQSIKTVENGKLFFIRLNLKQTKLVYLNNYRFKLKGKR